MRDYTDYNIAGDNLDESLIPHSEYFIGVFITWNVIKLARSEIYAREVLLFQRLGLRRPLSTIG